VEALQQALELPLVRVRRPIGSPDPGPEGQGQEDCCMVDAHGVAAI
jgi:hypothetical protein